MNKQKLKLCEKLLSENRITMEEFALLNEPEKEYIPDTPALNYFTSPNYLHKDSGFVTDTLSWKAVT